MYLPMNRGHSRALAIILIAVGLIMIPDWLFPTIGTDIFLNLPLGMFLADLWEIEYLEAIIVTYAFGFAMIAIGLLIYPYNTKRMLNGRLKAGYHFMTSHPLLILAGIAIFFLMHMAGQWFYDTTFQHVKEMIANGLQT